MPHFKIILHVTLQIFFLSEISFFCIFLSPGLVTDNAIPTQACSVIIHDHKQILSISQGLKSALCDVSSAVKVVHDK